MCIHVSGVFGVCGGKLTGYRNEMGRWYDNVYNELNEGLAANLDRHFSMCRGVGEMIYTSFAFRQ